MLNFPAGIYTGLRNTFFTTIFFFLSLNCECEVGRWQQDGEGCKWERCSLWLKRWWKRDRGKKTKANQSKICRTLIEKWLNTRHWLSATQSINVMFRSIDLYAPSLFQYANYINFIRRAEVLTVIIHSVIRYHFSVQLPMLITFCHYQSHTVNSAALGCIKLRTQCFLTAIHCISPSRLSSVAVLWPSPSSWLKKDSALLRINDRRLQVGREMLIQWKAQQWHTIIHLSSPGLQLLVWVVG